MKQRAMEQILDQCQANWTTEVDNRPPRTPDDTYGDLLSRLAAGLSKLDTLQHDQ